MNVTEMYAVLRERMVDAVLPYESEDSALFQWLQQAYVRIQQQSPHWEFLHNRGLVLTTTANKASYVLDVNAVDYRSLYAVKVGTTARTPVCKGDYRHWVSLEQSGSVPTGQPQLLIRAPNHSWIVYPTPSESWKIYGNFWTQPDLFLDGESEPIWDADLHSLVWMVALSTSIPRALEVDARYKDAAAAELTAGIRSMLQELYRRYLPSFRGL